jgi:uncharacterized phage infection (PIP) family protein YhgE
VDSRLVELKWIVPMIIGVIGFLACLFALYGEQKSGWDLLVMATLSAGFLGAGIFTKISLTKDGLIIESAQASAKGINDLKSAVTTNEVALLELKKRVEEIAQLTYELTKLPQTPTELAQQGEVISAESIDLTSALQSLGSSVRSVVESASAVKTTIGQLADYVGWNEPAQLATDVTQPVNEVHQIESKP